ncbi:NTP transferase domain-containing protein [Xylophilus sp. Kf1]|nr:NTP transferase domain-containing protein [Xylophilus sp. Kf1]
MNPTDADTASSTDDSNGWPTVLILASGQGRRFRAAGGSTHKLEALLGGRTVLQCTVESVRRAGLPMHLEHRDDHAGMGDSLAAAVRAVSPEHGWLVLPADMPMVLPRTLRAVAQAVRSGACAAQPLFELQRGHPVGFAARHGVRLAALSGDQGARSLLSDLRAEGAVVECPVDDPGVLLDIDTPQDLTRAESLWLARAAGLSA